MIKVLYAIIGALIVVILIQSIIQHNERKELYNRIMAGDLSEYITRTEKVIPKSRKGFMMNRAEKLKNEGIL